MPDKNLNFANIVATPTRTSWAQAYNAGKLFAVLSLEKKHPEESGEKEHHGHYEHEHEHEHEDEHLSLSGIGKEILTTLEQEYFSLETKDLESIKGVVQITVKKIPEDINYSFVVATVLNEILYLYSIGGGKVDIKRDEDFGTLLESGNEEHMKAVSGNLKNNDLIIIQTKQFAEAVTSDRLSSFLDHQKPSEIAETIAPIVHGGEEAAAASVIIQYFKSEENEEQISSADERIIEEKPLEEIKKEDYSTTEKKTGRNYFALITSVINYSLNLIKRLKISRSKGGLITIAIILITVFVIGIFLAIKRQNDAKVEAAFNEIYSQAQKKYDEGESLSDLNQNLARESFQEAEKILSAADGKFPKDSKQEKQINELKGKVNGALSSVSGINSISAKEVGSDASSLLSYETKSSGIAFTTDGKSNFYLDNKGVYKDGKEIVKNDSYWNNPAGLNVYSGNIYVLDRVKGGVLKFVPAGSGYASNTYFAVDVSPDLTDATSMTIDGSIWILLSDGSILKYTKGKADSFNTSGLDKAFSSPSKIYTDVDFDNIYILDNGNSRIVVLGKDGGYIKQYNASVLKNAKDFKVSESDKKAIILSSNKLYEIEIK